MAEKLAEKDEQLQTLQDEMNSLNNENLKLQKMAEGLGRNDRDNVTDLEKTRQEVEQLHLEIELLREDEARKIRELEGTVETLRSEKETIHGNGVETLALLEERVKELESENAHLKRLGNEQRGSSRMRSDLERQIHNLESENRDLVRVRTQTERELRREIERLKLEMEELQNVLNKRNEKVLLTEKVLFQELLYRISQNLKNVYI